MTAMATTLTISSLLSTSTQAGLVRPASTSVRQQARARLASTSSLYFGASSDLVVSRATKKVAVSALRVRSESGSGNASPDIWVGRVAMVGFAAALASEIITGKGVLASAGVITPQPTLALALAALVGGVTAFGVFRSASSE